MKDREGTEDNEKAAILTTTEVDREYDIVDELAVPIQKWAQFRKLANKAIHHFALWNESKATWALNHTQSGSKSLIGADSQSWFFEQFVFTL